jgi:hypothetical protein
MWAVAEAEAVFLGAGSELPFGDDALVISQAVGDHRE